MNKYRDNVVIIFAKKPELGKVKTRIARETSKQFAYDFSISCLVDLLNKINRSEYYDLIVAVDNKNDLSWFQKHFSLDGLILPDFKNYDKQKNQSKKFERIFSELLGNKYNYRKSVLIPMDIPFITEEDLISSFARLTKKKFVYGPEMNGGVYLIGMRKPCEKNVFQNIRWSSPYCFDDLTKNIKKRDAFFLKLKCDLNLPNDIINLKEQIHYNCPILFDFLNKNNFYLSLNNQYINYDDLSICIPIVSNIVEKYDGGKLQVLFQDRYKPSIDPNNINKIEIPSGLIKKYELAQTAAIRETLEETGVITKISDSQDVIDKIMQKNGDIISVYKPFLCCQQLIGGRSYLSITFISKYIKGKLSENYYENRNLRWLSIQQIKNKIDTNPDSFFGLTLGIIREYLKYRND